MLNYFERIENYKRQLYFQINGNYLDFYSPKTPLWSQDLLITKDILRYASERCIADSYGVLSIRFFAGEPNKEELHRIMDILSTANNLLSSDLGENDITKSLGLSPRHFSAILNGNTKKEKEIEDVALDVAEIYEFVEQSVNTDEVYLEQENNDTRTKKTRNHKPKTESFLDR